MIKRKNEQKVLPIVAPFSILFIIFVAVKEGKML